jgi:hypothetical protein
MNNEEILSEYLKSDEDKRMSMFLYYRELRDDFAGIDERGQIAAANRQGPA